MPLLWQQLVELSLTIQDTVVVVELAETAADFLALLVEAVAAEPVDIPALGAQEHQQEHNQVVTEPAAAAAEVALRRIWAEVQAVAAVLVY